MVVLCTTKIKYTHTHTKECKTPETIEKSGKVDLVNWTPKYRKRTRINNRHWTWWE